MDAPPRSKNDDEGSFISEGYNDFSITSLCISPLEGISDEIAESPTEYRPSDTTDPLREINIENDENPPSESAEVVPQENQEIRNNNDEPAIPKGKSIAHYNIKSGKIAYISFDIETGGEECGIIQLSAQIFRLGNNDTMETSNEDEFNKFVMPPEGAVWSSEAGKRVMISMEIKFYYYLLNSQLLYHTIHSTQNYCHDINWGCQYK